MKTTPSPSSTRSGIRTAPRARLVRDRSVIETLEARVFLSAAVIPANQPIASGPGVQQNPSIATDPLNSKHLVVSYTDRSLLTTGYAGIGVAVSQDGGKTWSHGSIPLPANFTQGAATPVTQFDNQGHVFVSFSAATFLGSQPGLTDPDFFDPNEDASERSFGFTSNNGIFVARSDDGGITFGTPTAVVSHLYDGTNQVLFEVTPDLAIDTAVKLPNGHTNPNFGNLYETWTRNYTPGTMPGNPTFTGGTDGIIAVSKDHGLTWQVQVDRDGVTALNDPVRSLGDGGPGLGYVDQVHVTVGPEGDVYVSDYGGGDFTVLHSTDAGLTFAAPDHSSNDRLAFGAGFTTYEDSTLGSDQFRTNSIRDIVADPTRPGVVYAVDTVVNADASTDVLFARSIDHGVHWSSSFKIGKVPATVLDDVNGGTAATANTPNQVTAGNAFARLSVGANGDLAVIWYDTRVDPANALLNVFGTTSTDGGKTFAPNFHLSDTTFDPSAGAFTDAAARQDDYLGDFIGLTIAGDTGYATWTDTRNGDQDIYGTQFSVTSPPAALNDRFEPNDSIAAATNLGSVLQSNFSRLQITASDSDWYSFSPTATGQISISATQATASSQSVQLQLYDSTGTVLIATGSAVKNSAGKFTGVSLSTAGTSGTNYLLHVTPLGSGSAYSLNLSGLTRNLGTKVYGQQSGTLATSDQDYFLLKVPAAGTLQVQLTPGPDATGTMSLQILNATTQAVLGTGAASGTGLTATASVSAGQSVLLDVSGDSTTSGSYSLTYTDLDQDTVAAASTLLPAGVDPSQSVVSDLTGKGTQDIVVANAASNTISVLLGNGNGTFQSARQYSVGPFGSTALLNFGILTNFRRAIAVADFNGDGTPDIAVTNYASGDVSVLLGNGDGTFQPQRRFNAVADPFDLAVGDLTKDGKSDIVTISANTSPGLNPLQETVGVLLGRGDGTFLPPKTFTIDLPTGGESPLSSVRIADFNGDGIPDLAISGGSDSLLRIYLGKGDGTFTPGQTTSAAQLGTGIVIGDVNGDGHPDVIATSFGTGSADLLTGNGDGTLAAPENLYTVGQGPVAVTLADFGSDPGDGSGTLGAPDGHPDLIIANSGAQLGSFNEGPPDVVVLPGEYGSDGSFQGYYGSAVSIYSGIAPEDVNTGDFNGDGLTDVAVTDEDGIHVVFGGTPTIVANDTPQSALNLGSVVHVQEPPLSIVPGRTDAYFDLTAPTEAASNTGNEVLDFSALFQHVVGTGLTMQVLDASGKVLATGDRFRLQVKQGQPLVVHVHGLASGDAGSFILDVDALPQVVSVAAESVLPGGGGPATSIVATFIGDRLDPAAAENPANYQVIYVGADGIAGTSDDKTIGLSSGASAIYDPGANVDVASGKTYPTAIRQTVTLLFDNALPVGSYEIKFSPKLVGSNIDGTESSVLASDTAMVGHPLVSLVSGKVIAGANVQSTGLVSDAGDSGDLNDFAGGTPFLTQLHSDLNSVLDSKLSATGDGSAVTQALLAQLIQRFGPALKANGNNLPPLLILFLDPVSLNLADPNGNRVAYNLQTNTLTNQSPDAFVSVTGNVEVLVMPIVAGSYDLNVSNVPVTARGGLAIVGAQTQETMALTDQIRGGQQDFQFGLPSSASSSFLYGAAVNLQAASLAPVGSGADSTLTTVSAGATSSTATPPPPNDVASANTQVAIATTIIPDDASEQVDDPNQPNGRKRRPRDKNHPATRPARNDGPTTRTASADEPLPADIASNEVPQQPVATAAPVALASNPVRTESPKRAVVRSTSKLNPVLVGIIAGTLLAGRFVEVAGGALIRRRPPKRGRRSR